MDPNDYSSCHLIARSSKIGGFVLFWKFVSTEKVRLNCIEHLGKSGFDCVGVLRVL